MNFSHLKTENKKEYMLEGVPVKKNMKTTLGRRKDEKYT